MIPQTLHQGSEGGLRPKSTVPQLAKHELIPLASHVFYLLQVL